MNRLLTLTALISVSVLIAYISYELTILINTLGALGESLAKQDNFL